MQIQLILKEDMKTPNGAVIDTHLLNWTNNRHCLRFIALKTYKPDDFLRLKADTLSSCAVPASVSSSIPGWPPLPLPLFFPF